jgi:hypothetical protein
MDAPETRLAIQIRNREINHLMTQTPVDHLAVEELLAANQRDVRALRIQTAQNLCNAAPRNPLRPELAQFLNRHFPHQFLKGAI